MNSVKKFTWQSKQLREYHHGTLTKKELREEWISFWWSDQIAAASW
jgi:hypothetical protein